MRFDPSIVTVKQSSIVSQSVVSSPIQDYVHPDDQTQPGFATVYYTIFNRNGTPFVYLLWTNGQYPFLVTYLVLLVV